VSSIGDRRLNASLVHRYLRGICVHPKSCLFHADVGVSFTVSRRHASPAWRGADAAGFISPLGLYFSLIDGASAVCIFFGLCRLVLTPSVHHSRATEGGDHWHRFLRLGNSRPRCLRFSLSLFFNFKVFVGGYNQTRRWSRNYNGVAEAVAPFPVPTLVRKRRAGQMGRDPGFSGFLPASVVRIPGDFSGIDGGSS